MTINVVAPMTITRRVLPSMLAAGWARIVNVLVFAASPLSAGCWFELRVAEFDLAASVPSGGCVIVVTYLVWSPGEYRGARPGGTGRVAAP